MKVKPTPLIVASVVALVLAWSIYASGAPDREVAGLIGSKAGALSDNQIVAELSRRIPPGTSQQAALNYLYKHGLDHEQLDSMPHQPPGGKFFIIIRNRCYIPNPFVRANVYYLELYIDYSGDIGNINVTHGWDHFGFNAG